MFPYLERSLNLLNPYLIHLDSDANKIDSLCTEQINDLFEELFLTEHKLAIVAMDRNQHEKSERHCIRCLSHSRRYPIEGQYKTTLMLSSLLMYSDLRQRQHNFSGAVTFAEDAYNLVAITYDPVHPQVQRAAGKLINGLMKKGDLLNAERYAQQTYDNLKDHKNGIDQEGDEIAQGAHNLAFVLLKQNRDLAKAEELVRGSLRIRTQLHGPNHHSVAISCSALAKFLKSQGNLGTETKELLERALALFVRHEGIDGMNTGVENTCSGQFHFQLAFIQPSEYKMKIHLLEGR
jgi:hypothetical protein